MIALAFTEPVAGSDNLLPCLDVKAGMKRAIPTRRGRHPRIGVEGAIGAPTGKMPRIMIVPEAPKFGKTPTPTGIPYLRTKKGKKERE